MVSDAFSCDLKTFEIEILSNHRNDSISSIQSCFSSNMNSSTCSFVLLDVFNISRYSWKCKDDAPWPCCVRLSVGIEDAQDLILDLEQAIKVRLKHVKIKEAAGHGGRSMHLCIHGRCLFNFSMVVTWY